jgi:hypothetical protein
MPTKANLKKTVKRTLPKRNPDILKGLLPEIPGFIYECINTKPTQDADLQEKVQVESLLLNKEAYDLSKVIPSWPDNVSLLTKFALRSPTAREWYALTDYLPKHSELPEVIKKYETTFVCTTPLNESKAALFQYIEDWASWLKRTDIKSQDYLEYLHVFNCVDCIPELSAHSKAFSGDMEALKTLTHYEWGKHNWVLNNPFAKTQAERDAWIIKIAPHFKVPNETLMRMFKRGVLPIEHCTATMFTEPYQGTAFKDGLALMHKHPPFRTKVIKHLLSSVKVSSYDREETNNINTGAHSIAFALECVKNKWVTHQELAVFFANIYIPEMMKLWETAETHYQDFLDGNWQVIAARNYRYFSSYIKPDQFLKWTPPLEASYIYYKSNRDPALLAYLKAKTKPNDIDSLDEESLLLVLKNNICPVAFIQVSKGVSHAKTSFTKHDLWQAWLSTVKPHMKPLDYKALVLYIIHEDPNMASLGDKYEGLVDRILTLVT